MNHDLADTLDKAGIEYERLSKSGKVRILSRWNSEFAALESSARKGDRVAEVSVDNTADEFLRACLMLMLAPEVERSHCPPGHLWRSVAAVGSLRAWSKLIANGLQSRLDQNG